MKVLEYYVKEIGLTKFYVLADEVARFRFNWLTGQSYITPDDMEHLSELTDVVFIRVKGPVPAGRGVR